MARVPASETTRKRIDALISGQSEGIDKSELVRAAARLIVEEALEEEVTDTLGREFYRHGARPGSGYRNGYRTGRLKSAEGAIEYSAPQIADRAEPFRSRVREVVRGRSEELEALAVEMYARGLSTRDVEAVFADEQGRPLLSRTAVSGITERLHLGQPREAVLAAWGITGEGGKVLLHLAPGTKEDTASCREFFQDM